jgi:hypothetical protein
MGCWGMTQPAPLLDCGVTRPVAGTGRAARFDGDRVRPGGPATGPEQLWQQVSARNSSPWSRDSAAAAAQARRGDRLVVDSQQCGEDL